MRIDFYHLTARPLEKVLPSICEKLVANGERLYLSPRQANPELRVGAGQRMEGELVFIDRLPERVRRR